MSSPATADQVDDMCNSKDCPQMLSNCISLPSFGPHLPLHQDTIPLSVTNGTRVRADQMPFQPLHPSDYHTRHWHRNGVIEDFDVVPRIQSQHASCQTIAAHHGRRRLQQLSVDAEEPYGAWAIGEWPMLIVRSSECARRHQNPLARTKECCPRSYISK